MAEPCVLCGHEARAPRRPGLPGVTSDCKPLERLAPLWACPACGLVQKAADPAWHAAVEAIYAGYEMYALSDGREQLVFSGGASTARSRVLARALAASGLLPATGSMLDFGCGNGSFFGPFREAFPGWRTAGLERDARRIEDAPPENRPDELFVGGPEAARGPFELITLLHALEHLPDPVAALAELRALLAPGGLLVALAPDCARNPFDLSIADHRIHLTPDTGRALLARAGFEALVLPGGPAKELVLAARPAHPAQSAASVERAAEGAAVLEAGLGWLEGLARESRSLAEGGALGVFGTAIGGVWLAEVLGDAARYFVDEDPLRQGKRHLGRLVLSPAQVPPGARVCLALAPEQARAVARRLGPAHPGRAFILPPGEAAHAL